MSPFVNIGQSMASSMAQGIRNNTGMIAQAAVDAVNAAYAAAAGAQSSLTLFPGGIGAGGGLSGVSGASLAAGPSFANTFNTNISSAIEEEEFYYRVQEAQRQAL